ncbi:MAG: hypothetical protein K1X79_04715 [Oligoflexia bacterium]|nr:hypothetical protein [Oligoflexia bacterium]
MNEQTDTKPRIDLTSLSKAAAGMLLSDGLLLLWLYPVVVLPRCLGSYLIPTNSNAVLYIYAVERLFYILFALVIASRWVRRVFPQAEEVKLSGLALSLLIGFGLWFSYIVPIAAQFLPLPNMDRTMLAVLLLPAIVMNLHFFFFLIPIALGHVRLGEILTLSRTLISDDRWIGPRCLLGPVAVLFLFQAVIAGFSPDQRHVSVSLLSDFFSGIYWLLGTYLSTAVGIHLAQQHSTIFPRALQQASTLTEASLSSTNWLSASFMPGKGFVMLCLGCLVWAGNLMRLAELPPAATIKIEKVSVQEGKVRFELKIQDPLYKLRGFHSIFLSLASEQRTPLAQFPSRAVAIDSKTDVLFGFPLSPDLQHVGVEFDTGRKDDDIKSLKDIFLWYRNTKLAKVEFAQDLTPSVAAGANP